MRSVRILPAELLQVGEVAGPYGLRGWIKVNSYTEDPGTILDYPHWKLGLADSWHDRVVVDGRRHGNTVVAQLGGCDDRDGARDLSGAAVAISRAQLPPLGIDEYYWIELEGLEVVNLAGNVLGRVTSVMETGANDVLVVSNGQETLIPYVAAVIHAVDLHASRIEVDWELDF